MRSAPEVIDLTQDSDDDDVRLKIKIRSEEIIELTDSEEEDEEKEKTHEYEYDKGKEMDGDDEEEEEEEEELGENQEEEIDGDSIDDNEEDETESLLCDAHLSEADVHRMIYEVIEAMDPAIAPGVVNGRRGIIGEGRTLTRRVNRNMKITLEEPLGPPSSFNNSRKGLYHCL